MCLSIVGSGGRGGGVVGPIDQGVYIQYGRLRMMVLVTREPPEKKIAWEAVGICVCVCVGMLLR